MRNVRHSSGQIFQNNPLRSDNNPYLADGVAGKRLWPLLEFGEFGIRLDESGSFARGTVRPHLVLHDENIPFVTFAVVAEYVQVIDPRFRELGLNQGPDRGRDLP